MIIRSLTLATVALLSFTPAAADTRQGVEAFMQGDYDAAVRIWRPLAIAGDADAQYNLGQAYWLGRGVANDPKQAEDWYRRAAEQGQPKARDAYGLLLFQTGRQKEALVFIEESAARGMPQAQYVLATALFNGDQIEKDWPRAYALMTRASAGGVSAASRGLAQLDMFIPLEQRQKGLQLARALERASLGSKPGELVAAPPPGSAGAPGPELAQARAPARTPAPAPRPAATPPVPAQAPAPAPKGKWRVQLGAVASAAKANALWTTLKSRVPALAPLQSFVIPVGAIVRLQAGSLPSREAATTVCAAVQAAKNPCFPVAP